MAEGDHEVQALPKQRSCGISKIQKCPLQSQGKWIKKVKIVPCYPTGYGNSSSRRKIHFWSDVCGSPRGTAGFIPPFFMEIVIIVVLFAERSCLELQDPECPGIPWRDWVWKEHTSPWRAPGNNCPHSLGMEIPWSRWWCSVLVSLKIHPDLWPISVLCCAFAPPASKCPSNLSSSVN